MEVERSAMNGLVHVGTSRRLRAITATELNMAPEFRNNRLIFPTAALDMFWYDNLHNLILFCNYVSPLL